MAAKEPKRRKGPKDWNRPKIPPLFITKEREKNSPIISKGLLARERANLFVT